MSLGLFRFLGRVSLGALCLFASMAYGQTLERQGVQNILGASEEVRGFECVFVVRNEDLENEFTNRYVTARYSTRNGVVTGAKLSLCAHGWDGSEGSCAVGRSLVATEGGSFIGSHVGNKCIGFGRLMLGRGLRQEVTGDGTDWRLSSFLRYYASVAEVTDQRGRGSSFPEVDYLLGQNSDFDLTNSSTYTGIYEIRGFLETGIGVLIGLVLMWAGGIVVARLLYGAVGLGLTLYANDGTYAEYVPQWYVSRQEELESRIGERFEAAQGLVWSEDATAGDGDWEQERKDRALTAQARLARSEGDLDPDKYSSERDSESEADRIGRRLRWGRSG